MKFLVKVKTRTASYKYILTGLSIREAYLKARQLVQGEAPVLSVELTK